MSKIVFINQQPSNHEDQDNPIQMGPSSVGRRIVQMMGITDDAFIDNFVRINVSPFHDSEGFDPDYWKQNANNFLPLLEGRRVVLLGTTVAKAFGFERSSYDYASWFDHPTAHVLFSVIPLPSGVNYLYNDPELMIMISSFLNICWTLRD